MIKPVLKWPGGKTQLLNELNSLITPELLSGHTYYESFIGGGALAFSLEHERTVINDFNSELINVYLVIRFKPEQLIVQLSKFQKQHSTEFYYAVRDFDKDPNYPNLPDFIRAARTIYLNKTCFNGLYRVNSKGYFNTPIGRTSSGKPVDIVQADRIIELHKFLQHVTILNEDFESSVRNAICGDTIYFDSPYDYETSGFVNYQKEGWTQDDLVRLKNVCDILIDKGCNVVVSNNDTTFVRELFKEYNFKEVIAKRSINSKGNNRSNAKEVIIYKIYSLN